MTPIHKTLLEIQQSDAYERLEPFKDSAIWSKMLDEERQLLATLLVRQGAKQLAQGNSLVLESFDIASKVSSNAADILLAQGRIFLEHAENPRCLTLASQAFAKATKLNPRSFDASFELAKAQYKLGLVHVDPGFLSEALAQYAKTEALAPESEKADVFWHWGRCHFSNGKWSGEPSDFYAALQSFQQAALLDLNHAKFWTDYGNAVAELGALLEKESLYEEALIHFTRAVELEPEGFPGVYLLACCLYQLGLYEGNEIYFEQGWHYYEKASCLEPGESQLWWKWGQLELSLGKRKRDLKLLEAALEKFERAHQLDPDNPFMLGCWAETELFLGTYHERVDLMLSARQKIVKAIEIKPEADDLWYLYGLCLNDLGSYFLEETYYHQAIEKFDHGLSLTQRNPLLWYGLGLAQYSLGEFKEDPQCYEKAVHCFARVAEQGGGFPQLHNDWGASLLRLAEHTQQIDCIEGAIAQFESALKPKDGILDKIGHDVDLEWVYNYGCALNLLGEILGGEIPYFEKAIEVLSQVIQSDPSYIQARHNLALALANLAEATSEIAIYQKAIEHFQVLLMEDPEDDEIHLDCGIAWINVAQLKEDAHKPDDVKNLYKQAELHLQQALALGKNEALYCLASLNSLLNNLEVAMHYLEKSYLTGCMPTFEEIMQDEWLEPLRATKPFQKFMEQHS